jgi:uncharacterized protein YuzE
MRLHVDQAADGLYLRLDDSEVSESQEVFPGVVLDCHAANQPVGVDIPRVSSRTPRPELGKLIFETTPVRRPT